MYFNTQLEVKSKQDFKMMAVWLSQNQILPVWNVPLIWCYLLHCFNYLYLFVQEDETQWLRKQKEEKTAEVWHWLWHNTIY